MGNAINQDARMVWIAMRSQGGWWTKKAMLHFWHPTFVPWEVDDIVKSLEAGGFIQAREVSPGEMSFAFTSECKLLPGEDDTGAGDFGRRDAAA